jgi:hypothetical protein
MLGMGTGAGLLGQNGHGIETLEGGGAFWDEVRKTWKLIQYMRGAKGRAAAAQQKYEKLGQETAAKEVNNPASAFYGRKDLLAGSGRRTRAPAGPSDGRRKRAEVVKKVMAEKGLSMIEASKWVKAHGLY